MEWSEGMRVEACRSENEYRRAWLEGVIVSANPEDRLYKICYDKIVTKSGQPLVQDVHPSHLRPIPPQAAFPLHCSAGDAVEAYENNGWWRGVIIRLVPSEEELWAVYILDCCIIKACRRSDLRPALQWQGGTWTVVGQERDPNIEQVTRFLTMDKAPKISFADEAQVTAVPRRGRPVSRRGRGRMRTQNVSFELTDLPNEAQVTTVPRRGRPVSHRGRGGMRTQNVSFELTDFAGDNSRISCRGRKEKRLVASIVPQSIQKDTGDNSRISWTGKKLKQIAKFVPPHIQEDVGNNSTISGEREKLRVRTQNVSFGLTDLPNEAQVTTVPRRGRPVSHRGRGRMRTQNVRFELTDLPTEAQVTALPRRGRPVSRRGRGRMRTQNVSFELTDLPNEAQVTTVPRRGRPVSHRGRGGMRTQNVSFELTDFAGDNSRISCRGRKKKRLVASIVSQSIQKDTGDNSRISCARKKLKLIAKFVPPHIHEDVGNNSTISGEREKLRVITDIMPLRIQEPSETHETWNGIMALDYQKENDMSPLLSPKTDSSKRVDEERNCRESPMGNEIQNLETDGEARRLEFSESKGRELVLLSRKSGEECPERSISKTSDCGVPMENNCSTYAREERSISKTSDCGVPMENNCSTYAREENISEGHMCELFVYQKMSWAFHTDSGTISQERLNLLDALRLRLNITLDEHKRAMEEAIIP